MAGDQPKRFLTGMFENLPGLSFLILSRASDDLRLVGWIGTILAATVCVAYMRQVVKPHPVLLGINIFMVVITPLIELLHIGNNAAAAQLLLENIDSLVLGSILVTGLALTLFTRRGFLTYRSESTAKMRAHSASLLAVCAMGMVWSLYAGDNHLLSLVLPLSLLFGLQQYLSAGAADKQMRHDVFIASAGSAPTTADSTI